MAVLQTMMQISNVLSVGTEETDPLTKAIQELNLEALQSTVSSVTRALGFGPEADAFATWVVVLLVFLVIVGYAAGPLVNAEDNKSATNSDKVPPPTDNK